MRDARIVERAPLTVGRDCGIQSSVEFSLDLGKYPPISQFLTLLIENWISTPKEVSKEVFRDNFLKHCFYIFIPTYNLSSDNP
jgi:hypothetical protein